MEKTVYRYSSFSDDVIENSGQDYHLPADYKWIRREWWAPLRYALNYALVRLIAFVYMRLVKGAHYEGREKLKAVPRSQGIFLYGNHTMPVGDVVSPVYVTGGRRLRTVVSNANYGLPVIGRMLPWFGALPLGETATDTKKMADALYERLGNGEAINIFPEAHVWPYYTGIRPIGTAAFHYQASSGAPAFTHCTVYNKPRHGRRPRVTVVVDGPFFPDMSLPPKARKADLCERVGDSLRKAAARSDYEYCEYIKI